MSFLGALPPDCLEAFGAEVSLSIGPVYLVSYHEGLLTFLAVLVVEEGSLGNLNLYHRFSKTLYLCYSLFNGCHLEGQVDTSIISIRTYVKRGGFSGSSLYGSLRVLLLSESGSRSSYLEI